jgi:hypothetical protein
VIAVNGAEKDQTLDQVRVFVKVQVGTVMIIAVQLVVLFRLLLMQNAHLKGQQLVDKYTACLVYTAAAVWNATIMDIIFIHLLLVLATQCRLIVAAAKALVVVVAVAAVAARLAPERCAIQEQAALQHT